MEFLHLKYSFIFFILFSFNDVSPLILNAVKSADKAILGETTAFTLSCTYTMEPDDYVVHGIQLRRKRDTDSAYDTIVNFYKPTDNLNVSYVDTGLESRTVATAPTGESKTPTLMFNRIECDDKASYEWLVKYSKLGSSVVRGAMETLSFTVKAFTLFPQDGRISYSPSSNLAEGDNVTFTCTGDVGNEPVGHLGWYYYLNNDASNSINVSSQAISTAPIYNATTCSYLRTSRLTLTMRREFGGIILRCTVHQDTFSQVGDGFTQTKNIEVNYSPMVRSIDDQTVDEGRESLTLICYADARPSPMYYWLFPNGTMSDGMTLTLTNLQIGDKGTYTCFVYNLLKGKLHAVAETMYLDVRSTDGITGTDKPAPVKGGDNDKTTTIIIAVVVPVVLIANIVVVVCLYLIKNGRPNKIEV